MSETTSREEQNQQAFNQAPPPPPQTRVAQQVGFDIPVESVSLPSKGRLYALDHPLANETEVEIRCMTAREEDLLTSRALIKNGTVMSKLLESCLMNKTIDPEDMLTGDRNALLIAIRVTGYGPEYTAKISCPECSEEHEQEFTLNNLKIRDLGAKPVQPNINLFEYTLPLSGLQVQFKLLTGKDESELSKIAERTKKMKSQVEKTVTSRLLYSIVAINGETDKQKIANVVNNMRAGDARALRKYMGDIEPDVDMKQWSSCPSCGEESEVQIPLGISFFWPDFG